MFIEYIADDSVSPLLDMQLRHLLSTCFPRDKEVFSKQRFYNEKPQHRYVVYDHSDNLIAHIAVHDKRVTSEEIEYHIAGIAEVCVLPQHRKKGYTRAILRHIHSQLRDRKIDFALLFGDEPVYAGSGYKTVGNLLIKPGEAWVPIEAMACEITKMWPKANVMLEGGKF